MKANKLIRFFFCLFFIIICSPTFATHLMGGGLKYTFVSFNSGTQTASYDVELTLYRSCNPGSSNLPFTVNLGEYIEDSSNANKVLFASEVLSLSSTDFVSDSTSAGCTFNPAICIEKGIYTSSIDLPFQPEGYHLLVDLCCRNTQILNLAASGNNVGVNLYAYVPPSPLANSSPVFIDEINPYLCVGDTVSLLNSAIDPDGDSLTYTFITPFEGRSNGAANPPNPNPYLFPIPSTNYNTNFSLAQPFGSSGFAFLNSTTGLSKYEAPAIGFYVMSLEIKEFRGGNTKPIGVTRRDVQFSAISCPVNNSPIQDPDIDSAHVVSTYTITAGQSICFDIGFHDAIDSIYLSGTGNVLNSLVTNPPASFTNVAGLHTTSSQFCWNTTCTQGGIYHLIVKAQDNGCPIKTTNVVYTINVLKVAPNSISGTSNVCGSQSNVIYTAPLVSGFSYNWTVSGGSIVSGQGSNQIAVDWGTGNSGNVSYLVSCNGAVVNFPVTISTHPAPVTAGPISGDTTISACINQLGIVYSIDTIANATSYNWTLPPNATISGNAHSNSIEVNYSAFSSNGIITVIGVNSCGQSTVSQLPITIKPIPSTEICFVTVDSASQKAQLFWQKPIESYVTGYVIYRQMGLNYIPIDTVSNLLFSSYTDVGSDPATDFESYKVGTLDSCGNVAKTDSVQNHTTINLVGFRQWPGVAKLYWTDYIGITDPNRYFRILRDSSGTGAFSILKDSISILTSTFTDTNAYLYPLCRYVIDMVFSPTCTPSLRSATAYVACRSNIGLFPNFVINEIPLIDSNDEIKIYPNPAKEKLIISNLNANSSYQIYLYNTLGKMVLQTSSNGKNQLEIRTENLSKGLYLLKMNSQVRSTMFKIQHE